MKIALKKLNGATTRLAFEETLDLSDEVWYGQKPFTTPAKAQGEVTRESGVLRLRGSIRAIYHTSCARCLRPLEILLSAEADTVLTDDQTADEDEDLFVLTDDTVDTAEVLVPALLLQIDMVYLCSPGCKGLCPQCGCDRNTHDCSCSTKRIDPRFAALRALLDTPQSSGNTEE